MARESRVDVSGVPSLPLGAGGRTRGCWWPPATVNVSPLPSLSLLPGSAWRPLQDKRDDAGDGRCTWEPGWLPSTSRSLPNGDLSDDIITSPCSARAALTALFMSSPRALGTPRERMGRWLTLRKGVKGLLLRSTSLVLVPSVCWTPVRVGRV